MIGTALTGSTILDPVASEPHGDASALTGAEELLALVAGLAALGPASGLVLAVGAVDVAVAASVLGDATLVGVALEVAAAARHVFWNKQQNKTDEN